MNSDASTASTMTPPLRTARNGEALSLADVPLMTMDNFSAGGSERLLGRGAAGRR